MPPRTVGPWEILSVAGRGGVGTVYRARHRASGGLAALKILAPPPAAEPSSARRLAREYEALAGLDHPNVVRVLGVGVCEGYSYLAMELVEGLDLRTYLSPSFELVGSTCLADLGAPHDPLSATFSDEPDTEGLFSAIEQGPAALLAFAARLEEPDTVGGAGPAPELAPEPPTPPPEEPRPHSRELLELLNARPRMERVRDALRQVCRGLAHVHARGLVHRDLKPSNVMVDDSRCVRIMDFGLVRFCDDSTAAGAPAGGNVVGTYRYMAPEQARGLAVDARADLYSLGVILFELLSGRPPFLAERGARPWLELLSRPAPDLAALNPGADARLSRIAERLLRKDPAERYRSAEEVAAALAP